MISKYIRTFFLNWTINQKDHQPNNNYHTSSISKLKLRPTICLTQTITTTFCNTTKSITNTTKSKNSLTKSHWWFLTWSQRLSKRTCKKSETGSRPTFTPMDCHGAKARLSRSATESRNLWLGQLSRTKFQSRNWLRKSTRLTVCKMLISLLLTKYENQEIDCLKSLFEWIFYSLYIYK